MKRLSTFVFLVACAAAAIATTAVAAPTGPIGQEEQISRFVRLRDLDLNSQAGAREAADRIRVAAESVCDGHSPFDRQTDSFRVCRDEAIGRAAASLRAPL